jgi:hypothetical protein
LDDKEMDSDLAHEMKKGEKKIELKLYKNGLNTWTR